MIEDDGPGIDGTPEEIARLFSIDRPLMSSKLFRKPQRGALGNGLRVVAGTLIASGGGSLKIRTRDKLLRITPLEDGGADVHSEPVEHPVGRASKSRSVRCCLPTRTLSAGRGMRS